MEAIHARRRRSLVIGSVAVLALAGIGIFTRSALSERGGDKAYDTAVKDPALAKRRPRVLFDQGHNNVHSISGRFLPFARLLRADGCEVAAHSAAIDARALSKCDVLVIVNAAGPGDQRESPAFTDAEVAAIRDWVSAGGSLLLVADHHPFGPAAAPLAEALSVRMIGGWCNDEARFFPGTADSGAVAFRRDDGLIGAHPITTGRSPGEAINVVVSFTGQSLVAPEAAAPLLIFSDTAVDSVPIGSKSIEEGGKRITTFETRDTSAAGHCQALAMTLGKGRVVVLGEAAMISAQVDVESGIRFGMNVPGVDNRQFVLNTVRWLAGALDEPRP